jgi:uncharacterized membrane protein YfcA
MTPLVFTFLVFATSVFAGFVGSLLGLGGGIIIIPALTLVFGIDIHFAIGASIVSVIATSSGAAAAYVRENLTNLRVAMFLELGTTAGALSGAYLAGILQGRWLFFIFAVILSFSAFAMFQKRHSDPRDPVPPDRLADRLKFHSEYTDQSGAVIPYRVTRSLTGLVLMYIAGVVSGLLGIGSGVLKVPAMDLAMHLPIKVSSATSNFMIGVTAAASAGVYFMRGQIDPFIAAPVAAGVLVGAAAGSSILPKLNRRTIRIAFIIILVYICLQMFYKGLVYK